MEATQKPRVKICCIGSIQEAWLAIHYGASALGLVSAMPSGPGVIDEMLIAEIAHSIPPGVTSVLLTSQQNADAIIEQQRRCHVNALQLVDSLPERDYKRLRQTLPGIDLIQVIHVIGEESITKAQIVAPYVDAILLDSGNPTLAIKELGGTGRVHNWEISARLREEVNVPIFLAGGLRPENVQAAIQQVGPYGLDICSGVRSNGLLDSEKLSLFFKCVHSVA